MVTIPIHALKEMYGKAWENRDFAAMRSINADKNYGHGDYIDWWEMP